MFAQFLMGNDGLNRGKTDQNIDDALHGWPRTQQLLDKIVVVNTDKTPIESSDDQEDKGDDMHYLHILRLQEMIHEALERNGF